MNRNVTKRYVSGQERTHGRSYNASRYGSASANHIGSNHTIPPRPAQTQKTRRKKSVSPTLLERKDHTTLPRLPRQNITNGRLLTQDAVVSKKTITNPVDGLGIKPAPKQSSVLRRSTVVKPHKAVRKELPSTIPASKERKSQQPLVRWRFLLSSFALFVLVGILGGSAAFVVNGHQQEQQKQDDVLADQTNRTSAVQMQQPHQVIETEVTSSDIDRYTTDDSHPRLIKIETIDLAARTKASGVNRQNQLILPENIFDVNWYEGSRVPGQTGAVLMSGYVSGPNERGAFYYLRALEHGDIITVETGDGTEYRYEIKHREYIPYDQVDVFSLHVPHEPGTNGLHLMAVDDRYNVMNNDFQDRLVIYAVEI